MAFDGADAITADGSGDLVVKIGGVELRSRKPRIYQRGTAGEDLVNGRYAVLGKRTAGFVMDAYDPTRSLVVDPILSYASFLGGEASDVANGVAMDPQGNIYLAGSTNSSKFPTKSALYPGLSNATSVAFVAKFNPAASGENSLIFSTYIGGNVSDEAFGLALDSSNNIYITGRTLSTNYPLRNAFQVAFSTATNCTDSAGNPATCEHAFVTELAANGKSLVYSSNLGGTNQDEAFGIGVDAAGNAYVMGQTFSTDFPTAGSPYQSTQKGTTDAGDVFVCEVTTNGTSLAYSTYFGGSKAESPVGIAVSPGGMVYIAGSTTSTDLPTTSNALQGTASGGPGDSFLSVFNPKTGGSGSLVYSTYLAGKDGSTLANAVAVDAAGVIYVTGATNADDYPVSSGAFSSHYAGSLSQGGIAGVGDVFITKLDITASGSAQVVYSTFFGGALDDEGFGIAVDSTGLITVAGQTDSLAMPVTGDAFQRFNAGPSPTGQGFIARFDPSKSGTASLIYSTYIGGSQSDELLGVAVDKTGNFVAAAGSVESSNPPITVSAVQKSYGGGSSNAYVVELDFTQSGPTPRKVLNGASLVDTGLSPGLIFTVIGSGLGPAEPEVGGMDVHGLIPTTLAGVQLLVDNVAAPLLYVSQNQINAVAPYELSNRLGGNVSVQVIYNGVGGSLVTDLCVIAAPAIFSSGDGQGIILNQDGSLNGPHNPAPAGSKIQIFATGEGLLIPDGVDGQFTNLNSPPRPVLAVTATIGGATANISYAGTVPGSFEGFFEVDATIPAGASSGNNPVELSVGGIASTPVNVVVQ